MLKRSLLFLLLLAPLAPLGLKAAGADAKTQILFEPGKLFPAHGGPGVKVAFLQEHTALLMGGRGGLVLNETLGLGFGGYSLASELLVENKGVVNDLGLSYAGAVVDHSFYARRLYYFNVGLLVGGGQAWSVARMAGSRREYVSFFVLEPELNWMLNVTNELRLSLGVSTRLALGNDVAGVLGTQLPGFAATITLWYGKI